jgi:hypothetical protein
MNQQQDRGRAHGRAWADRGASYEQLRALAGLTAKSYPAEFSKAETVFFTLAPEHRGDRGAAAAFWEAFPGVVDEDFLAGFLVTARERATAWVRGWRPGFAEPGGDARRNFELEGDGTPELTEGEARERGLAAGKRWAEGAHYAEATKAVAIPVNVDDPDEVCRLITGKAALSRSFWSPFSDLASLNYVRWLRSKGTRAFVVAFLEGVRAAYPTLPHPGIGRTR